MNSILSKTNFFVLTFLLVLIGTNTSNGQANMFPASTDVASPFYPQNMIENSFFGEGIEVVEFTYSGLVSATASQLGYFTGFEDIGGFDDGICLSSGYVQNVFPYGLATSQGVDYTPDTYAYLDALLIELGATTGLSRDATYLEIEFIPSDSVLQFDYMMASQEYISNSWPCNYYDVFGFFISGPGISGGYGLDDAENIALVPGTTDIVSIKNINNTTGCPANTALYNDNATGASADFSFAGYTDVLTAYAYVTPCSTYTMRIAVSDRGDQAVNTAVFLKAKSFNVPTLNVDVNTNTIDKSIAEGCGAAEVTLYYNSPVETDDTVHITLIGETEEGIDHDSIPDYVIIPAGDSSVSFNIDTYDDGIEEGVEELSFYVIYGSSCYSGLDTHALYIKDKLLIEPEPMVDTTICPNDTLFLDLTSPTVLQGPIVFTDTFNTNIGHLLTQGSNIPWHFFPLEVEDVTPLYVYPGMIQSVCMNIDISKDDWVEAFLISPDGDFMELTTDNGGTGDDYINTCFTPTADSSIAGPNGQSPATWAPFTGNFLPEKEWSYVYGSQTNGTWQLMVRTDDYITFGTFENWTLTFEPQYEIFYEWSNDYNISCLDCPNPNVWPETDTTYYLRIYDTYGCEYYDTINVFVNQPIDTVQAICGDAGLSSLTANWGAIPNTDGYMVSIDNGTTWVTVDNTTLTYTFSGLTGDTDYDIIVQAIDPNCPTNTYDTITCTTLDCTLDYSIDAENGVTCYGATDGSFSVSASGGFSPYTYTFGTTTQATGDFSGVAAGTHTVSIEDDSSCVRTFEVTIATPDSIAATSTIVNVNCNGGTTGSITFHAIGGTGDYDYTLQGLPQQADSVFTGLSAGTYSYTITDDNSCTHISSLEITEPTLLELAGMSEDASCFGGNDGEISLQATGGTGMYSYELPIGTATQQDSVFTDLTQGTYQAVVHDENGCTDTVTITVDQPAAMTSSTGSIDATCNGSGDGTAWVIVTNGTAPYNYNWGEPYPIDNDTAIGLDPGTYPIIITDANSCLHYDTAYVGTPNPIQITLSATPVSCFAGSNGTTEVNTTGGVPPYTFEWNGDASLDDSTTTGMQAGWHTVIVTDNNGCALEDSIEITSPTAINDTVSINNVSCNGLTDGNVTFHATGGTGIYNYTLEGLAQQADSIFNDLAAGTYSYTITDANNCTYINTLEITEPELLDLEAMSEDVNCNAGSDGEISLQATGGTGVYSYELPLGAVTQSDSVFTGLTQGAYQAVVHDENGCTDTITVTIGQPSAMASSTGSVDATCSGSGDGTAWVIVAGGTPPYSYDWGASYPDNDTAIGLDPGAYPIIITDGNNCLHYDTAYVGTPNPIQITLSSTPASCFGGDDGTTEVNTTGGVSPYTFEWDGNDLLDDSTATGLQAGWHTVVVTDDNGCSLIDSVEITSPTAVMSTTSADSTSCFGGDDGVVYVIPSGGTAPYTFNWDAPLADTNNDTIQGLSAGEYHVTIYDINNCEGYDTIIVPEPTELNSSTSSTSTSCFEGSDGTVSVEGIDGTPSYTFQWDANAGNSTLATVSNLATGTYLVTITDWNGCEKIDSATVNEPSLLQVNANAITAECGGESNGTAVAVANGGTGPYDFEWSNGSTIDTAYNLNPTDYYVTVTDDNGCTAIDTVNVSEPEVLAITLGFTDASCYNGTDGTVNVFATGGTPNYTYAWNTGTSNAANDTVIGVGAGTYTVTVTDNNGCDLIDSITVGQPTELLSSTDGTDINCFGGSDGVAWVTVTGGTTGYSYAWNASVPSANMDTLSNVPAGEYIVTVTDGNTCIIIDTIVLNEPTLLESSTSGTDISCNGGSDGTASVIATGGTTPHTFIWDAPVTDPTLANISGLNAGEYHVTITDGNDCITFDTVTLTEPIEALTVIVDTTIDVSCFGGNDGSIEIVVSGGTAPYTIYWNTIEGDETFTGIAGTHNFQVIDDNGCSFNGSATINQPTALTLITDAAPLSCNSGNDGEVWAIAGGGTGPYTYDWGTAGAGDSLANLPAGDYNVTVTDANNCTITGMTSVLEPQPMQLTETSQIVSCFGGDDGLAAVQVVAGSATGPFTYAWDGYPSIDNDTLYDVPSGTYTVSVSDADGCGTSIDITIEQPAEPLLIDTIITIMVSCNGGEDASATVLAIGGTDPYEYEWSNGEIGASINNVAAGSYTVTVTDFKGCEAIETIEITEPTVALDLEITATIAQTCNGLQEGAALATVTGGTPDPISGYLYSWSSGDGTALAENLGGGIYTLTITDANGCTVTDQIEITELPAINMVLSSTPTTCYGGNDGTVSVDATSGGAAAGYIYNWEGIGTGSTQSGLSAGIYTVNVIDSLGCLGTAQVEVQQPEEVQVSTEEYQTVSCRGGADAIVVATTEGGTTPYTYAWSSGHTGDTVTNVTAGIYTVTSTDAQGCSSTSTIEVVQPSFGLIVEATSEAAACSGDSTGTATASATGGTAPYTFDWGTSGTGETITNLLAGSYIVVVTDFIGCEDSLEVVVEAPAMLDVNYTVIDLNCNGDRDGEILFEVSGGVTPYTYNYGTSSTQSPNIVALAAGDYIVNVSDDNGCSWSDTIEVTEPLAVTAEILVNGFGSGGITLDFVEGDSTVELTADVQGVAPWVLNWSSEPAIDLSCIMCDTSWATINDAGNIYLEVMDANGCFGAAQQVFSTRDEQTAFVASAFTPTESIGTNDVLFVQSPENYTVESFSIYDRWGELIFVSTNHPTNDPSYGWDGTIEGELAMTGAYVWNLVITDENGDELRMMGSTFLVK